MPQEDPTKAPTPSVAYALETSNSTGLPLPPGELVNLNQIEWTDRRFLLEQSKHIGPIFKALNWDDFWICIVGLRECQRFILENDEFLTPQTLDLKRFFPKGFLRQMQGDTHMHYRRALVRAISPEVMSTNQSIHSQTIQEALESFHQKQVGGNTNREDLLQALNRITSGLLIQIFFGARYGSETFERLVQLYQKLGPNGLVWQLGDDQEEAYNGIRDCLKEQLAQPDNQDWLPECILELMNKAQSIDDTMLGNLIYMVEMGRYDMYSLFRWITKFVTDFSEWADKVATEENAQGKTGKSISEAFVLETLRLEQIERLLRTVEKDLEFGGYLFPKGCTVRLCLWESHKLPNAFPEPFEFKPERFLDRNYTLDQYAPFGLGKHQCPFGEVAIRMSKLFLETLVNTYRVHAVNDGLAIRGMYHWEPAYQFSVQLSPKL